MNIRSKYDMEGNAQRQTMGEDKVKDITAGEVAEAPAPEPSTTAGKGVDSSSDGQPSAAPPAPPTQGDSDSGKDASASSSPEKNPFDQYYAQLTHQQNMLQDSVRVTAYQRAISENRANFKVRRHREKHVHDHRNILC